jgi:hypothetical protein
LVFLFAVACGGTVGRPPHPLDLQPVKGDNAGFDPNHLISDADFTDARLADGDSIQAFLEQTPYGHASWLTAASIGGRRAADAIVDAARGAGLSPLLLLTRMQVEQSLVSPATRPDDTSFALGCHVSSANAPPSGPDPQLASIEQQLHCGATSLADLFAHSADGTGAWRAHQPRQTLDPETVNPDDNGTAALYGYTPWVLRGRGGNWLHINVFTRFVSQAQALGLIPK